MRVVRGLGLAGLALVLLVSAGCAALFGGGDAFVLPEAMPPDFQVSVSVQEAAHPPVDYVLHVERSGSLRYEVTVRVPRRSVSTGDVALDDAAVQKLWDAVRESGFDRLPSEYVPGDGAEDLAVGLRDFYVFADGRDKRIEARRVAVPALAKLQAAILSVTPEHVLKGGGGSTAQGRPEQYVADETTRRFHRPDCSLCKEIPAGKRRVFKTEFEALNFRFDPCGQCTPLKAE